MAEGPRIVFMGTPRFAAIVLQNLLDADQNIAAVYTRPDKPVGRGHEMNEPEVKKLARKYDLPVFQPGNFRDPFAVQQLANLAPDYLIVAAYGLILPQSVLDTPKMAPLNIHASLLPHYRGAAPIQRAIMENWQPDAVTGVSIMRLVKALDAGPVYATQELSIAGRDTPSLTDALAQAGASLLLSILPNLGHIKPVPQDDSMATYAPKLEKTESRIDWTRSVLEVDAFVRAMNPWPGAKTTFEFGNKALPVLIRGGYPSTFAVAAIPGSLYQDKKRLYTGCADGFYEITVVQRPGRRELTAAEFINGQHIGNGMAGLAS